jgi:signal transduction histidine kinase/CheY-like chemotaxis protein
MAGQGIWRFLEVFFSSVPLSRSDYHFNEEEFTMKGRTILVVDDNDNYRNGLLQDLQAEGARAEGAESGEDAVRMMEADPQRYQFAVIDHVLHDGLDGIQTTKELVDRNQNLFALVFTNVPTDSREDIARFKYEALSAGAYRYLERGSEHDAPKQVKDFITEIEQLVSLRSWIQDYYENREQVPSLLTQLDIGVDVIDRAYKVWFVNDAMRRITGLLSQELPREACSAWHGYRFWPCPGCLVRRTFDSCESQERVFLSPLIYRDEEKLYFMNVWTQPIRDRKGDILRGADGKPLAVMESVQALTDTEQLRKMPLVERLNVIAGALRDRPVDGSYLGEPYFEKVEIYLREEPGQDFILKAASGFTPPLSLGGPTDLYAGGYLTIAEEHMRKSGCGYFFPRDGLTERVVYWPILEDDRLIAVLKTSGGDYCNVDSIPFVKPYAEEVRIAIRDAQSRRGTGGEIAAEIESEIVRIDLRLQMVTSPEEALKALVSSACELTGSHMAVLRYREEDDAVLLPLRLEKFDAYERITVPRHPLSQTGSLSSKVIISGQEVIIDAISISEDIKRFRLFLPAEARKVLEGSKALCFEPLLFGGRCIGAFGLYAKDRGHYSDEVRLGIVRGIARRIAFALHDHMVDREAQKRLEDTQYETIGIVLHNIRDPLGTIRYALDRLKKHVNENYPSDEYAGERLEKLDRQVLRISRTREEFLKLQQGWKSREEETDTHELIRDTVDGLVKRNEDASVEYDLDDGIRKVSTDAAAIRACLEVLVQNSLDELDRDTRTIQIKISLREASIGESAHLPPASDGLAIDVEDNGPGVPPEIVKDLFSVIRSGKAKGLGSGLAYCRKVARTAGGEVYYHDEHQVGAKFTLVLPCEPLSQGADNENSHG